MEPRPTDPMENSKKRAAGVLLHPTSLPGPHGIGALGRRARQFVECLARAGVKRWQVLPLVPPGAGQSPYSSGSAFACNPWLIDLEALNEAGLLTSDEIAGGSAHDETDRVNWGQMMGYKGPRLALAASRLPQGARDTFREREPWVDDVALFYALRGHFKGLPFWEWPAGLRSREASAMNDARTGLADAVNREVALQALVDEQWRGLRAFANVQGVRIVGDMPFYVDADSADVWANPHLFELDAQGRRIDVSGVPPDAFSDTGQLWGNPLYRWGAMRAEGYAWWVARLRRLIAQTDFVRIDHFRAFQAYWAVPAGAQDARAGEWRLGPGVEIFEALRRGLGALPILAEDLGIIDDDVRALLRAADLPGMKILQFAFGESSENHYLPHNHTANSVVYTGTHDNATTMGFWRSAGEPVRDHIRRYFGVDGHDAVWDLIRAAMASVAETAIVPFQDLLALGDEARMNIPAVAEGNWGWRMKDEMLRDGAFARLRSLILLYGR